MKRILAFAVLTAFFLSTFAFPQQDVAARIKGVEAGLLPMVLIENGPRWSLPERMAYYHVPGISIAVINDFKVEWVKGYGVLDTETKTLVTEKSLFQAASISKPVAAMAALKMAQEGKLDLDADVNSALKSWKLPDNEFTAQVKVTLKHLLSHTGGVTVSGFPGYVSGNPLPTLVQILNGEPPANTVPIRVDILPGRQFRYAGGGFTILQQMLIDLSGKPFPAFMKEVILNPLRMAESTFDQPLPPAKLSSAAAGHLSRGRAINGKRNVYPEMAAAGLWTTPGDLARFAVEIQLSLQGRSNKILSQASLERMLTRTPQSAYGLGFSVDPRGYFSHGGGNAGFTCLLIAHKKDGYGAVVMTNSSNGPSLYTEILRGIAREYKWENFLPAEQKPVVLDARQEEAVLGQYTLLDDETANVIRDKESLVLDGYYDEKSRLVPVTETTFVCPEKGIRLTFARDESGRAASFSIVTEGNRPEKWERRSDPSKTPYELLREGKTTEALESYRRIWKESPARPMVAESRLNSLGYRLLNQRKNDLAVAVLSLATEFYPRSANACDSLAEAYTESGDKAKASQYYQKVLDLVPLDPSPNKAALENLKSNAVSKLKELRGPK